MCVPILCAEKTLLELQRVQMERAVADQIESERAALLGTRMAVMRAEVEKSVADERERHMTSTKQVGVALGVVEVLVEFGAGLSTWCLLK